MKDYVLFVDTETSGWPKDWRKPYSVQDNWPYILQIAWVIYTKDGREVKAENFFINDDDFEISPVSRDIHGITREFLAEKGERRQKVMGFLHADLEQYAPLVVGHFMKFDFHMLGAGFHRTDLSNPLDELPMFCTMEASPRYVQNPAQKYLNLGDLYRTLFQAPLHHQHDALVDARATARCFFEMIRRGDLTESHIDEQQKEARDTGWLGRKLGVVLMVISLLIVLFSFFYLL